MNRFPTIAAEGRVARVWRTPGPKAQHELFELSWLGATGSSVALNALTLGLYSNSTGVAADQTAARGAPRRRRPGHCRKCGKEGHWAQDCRASQGRGPRCYACNEWGHIKRECPKGRAARQGLRYYHCSAVGHFARDCPEVAQGGEKRLN